MIDSYIKGFRDIYRKLIDKYNFEAKIPTCNQIEQVDDIVKGRLSTKQTNATRLVTKVF
jgi:hypothetical protein